MITKRKNRKYNKRRIITKKQLKGGTSAPPLPSAPLFIPFNIYFIHPTKDNIPEDDKRVRLVYGHGVILPKQEDVQFELKDGNNVIYIINSGQVFRDLNNMMLELCKLISYHSFDLKNIFDINKYNEIKGSQDNKILTNEHLMPEYKKFILDYKFYRQQYIENQNIIQNNLISNKYATGYDLLVAASLGRKDFRTGNVEFKLHIGGQGRKCNNVFLSFDKKIEDIEQKKVYGILEKIENSDSLESFKLNFKTDHNNKFLSQIFDHYNGTLIVVCCRKFNESISKKEKDAVRELSRQPVETEEDIEDNKIPLSCMNYGCLQQVDSVKDIGSIKDLQTKTDKLFYFCKFCKRFYCKDEHIETSNHNCIRKCELCDDISSEILECTKFGCEKRFCQKIHYMTHLEEHFKDQPPYLEILIQVASLRNKVQELINSNKGTYLPGTKEFLINYHLNNLDKNIYDTLLKINYHISEVIEASEVNKYFTYTILPNINSIKQKLASLEIIV